MYSHTKGLGIVVGVDGSPASKAAVEWAARDARLRSLALTLVHVVPARTPRCHTFMRERPHQRARRIMEDALAIVDGIGPPDDPPRVSTMVTSASPVDTLARLSADADIIVVGSRRQRAWWRGLHRSVSSGVLHRSQCPVAIVHYDDRPVPHPRNAPVLVRYGGSVAAALLAREEASRRGVELVISDDTVSRLIEQSDSAQLAIVGGWDQVGAAVAHAARTPVIVAS